MLGTTALALASEVGPWHARTWDLLTIYPFNALWTFAFGMPLVPFARPLLPEDVHAAPVLNGIVLVLVGLLHRTHPGESPRYRPSSARRRARLSSGQYCLRS